METKKIIIDGKEVEIALKLDEEYYEKNFNLEDIKDELEEMDNEDE